MHIILPFIRDKRKFVLMRHMCLLILKWTKTWLSISYCGTQDIFSIFLSSWIFFFIIAKTEKAATRDYVARNRNELLMVILEIDRNSVQII